MLGIVGTFYIEHYLIYLAQQGIMPLSYLIISRNLVDFVKITSVYKIIDQIT